MIFKPQKKYCIDNTDIEWVFLGSTSYGNKYAVYSFYDRVARKRKQYKYNELKKLNIVEYENKTQ